jgi:flagellar basal-body rod protein FlgC
METNNTVFRTSLTAMLHQRRQIEIASENLANAQTTRTSVGGPYKPKEIRYAGADPGGFKRVMDQTMQAVKSGRSAGADLAPTIEVRELDRVRHEFNPNHPDADSNGMVAYPDVDTAEEMHRMMTAMRLYEANLNAIEAEKEVIKRSFELNQ